MEQQLHHTCERTKPKQKQNQVKSHSNSPRVLLIDLAHKQCIGIIKGWLHMFGSSCLVTAQIQFSLIKKDEDWTSSTLANPQSSTSDNISFLPYPPTPLKVDVICVSPLKQKAIHGPCGSIFKSCIRKGKPGLYKYIKSNESTFHENIYTFFLINNPFLTLAPKIV